MATEEITISELELAENVLDDMVTPVETTTETKAVTLKQIKKYLGSALPTGFIIPAVGRIDDSRFTLLDGKTLSRTGTYKDFCEKVVERIQAGEWFGCTESEYSADVNTYGQCGRFVVTDDYIRIPKITRFLGATVTLSEIGKTYAESLPNITGNVGFVQAEGNRTMVSPSGAFYDNGTSGSYSGGDAYGTSTANFSGFNASRSSSTYQDNAKVQPDHTKYFYYMVISTEGQQEEITVDINKVYEDMELKANKDLSNCTKPYLKETYINGTSGYNIWSNGYCEQWGVATYPQVSAHSGSNNTITFAKTFANANYNFNVSIKTDASSTTGLRNYKVEPYTGSIVVGWYSTTTTEGTGLFYWCASGYLASGQY